MQYAENNLSFHINKLQQIIKKPVNRILIAILVFSFFIRIIHIYFDLPILNVVDEAGNGIYPALNMLQNKTLIIPSESFYYYPGLTAYLFMPLVALWIGLQVLAQGGLDVVQEMVILNKGADLFIVGRFISIMAGMVTVYWVYKIARIYLNNKYWALLASFLTSINLVFLIETTFGKPRAISAMFITIAIYVFLKIQDTVDIKKQMLLMGFLGGMAYTGHQSGGLLFVLLLMVSIFYYRKHALWSLLSFLVVFSAITALNPGVLFHNFHQLLNT